MALPFTEDLCEAVRAGGHSAVLIAGPTASGKSALAIRLAKSLDGVVVNADSMQVYADLRVLSARPTPAEEAEVPHRLFGFVPAAREYSAGDYLRQAQATLADVQGGGHLPILVGGTGLYFRALTEGLVATPEVAESVREEVAALEAGGGLDVRLARLDPQAAARLAPADRPRRMRALEVMLATGRPLAEWQGEAQGRPVLAPGSWLGAFLDPQRERLFSRIDQRFEAMMHAGALDEVRALEGLGLPANRGVMKAHGVPHLLRHLRGELPLPEAIALGQRDTRRYAKRQLTWARRFMADWRWISMP